MIKLVLNRFDFCYNGSKESDNMATPHNKAEVGMIAKTVLMPGDPLRAKYIAETFLEDVVQFNAVRNMFGFTGTYKGKKISVMGSGMGMPSIGIYSYELYKFFMVLKISSVSAVPVLIRIMLKSMIQF